MNNAKRAENGNIWRGSRLLPLLRRLCLSDDELRVASAKAKAGHIELQANFALRVRELA